MALFRVPGEERAAFEEIPLRVELDRGALLHSFGGNRLVLGRDGGSRLAWIDLESGRVTEPRAPRDHLPVSYSALGLDSTGRILATLGTERPRAGAPPVEALRVRDLASGRTVFARTGSRSWGLEVGPRGARAWFVEEGLVLRAVELARGSLVAEFPSVEGFAVSRGGDRVAVLRPDRTTVEVLDVATGRPVDPPLPHEAAVGWMAFGPSDETLVTRTATGALRSWRRPRGNRRVTSPATSNRSLMAIGRPAKRLGAAPRARRASW